MASASQPCSEPGCVRAAAYRTRTKPAWCDPHITAILLTGGLEPLQPFEKPGTWRLTRCVSCGCVAHYRFEYVLDQNRIGEQTCRACHWRRWAAETRRLQGPWANTTPTADDVARIHAEEHGFEYLEALTSPSLPDDPHRTRCLYCGRLSAQRLGDIGFGCSCQSNPRRSAQTPNVSGPRVKDLLRDSGLRAVQWWDHDLNDEAALASVVVKARREAHWRCPECDHRFVARIVDMTGWTECPKCAQRDKAERDTEYARLRVTAISAVPVLAAAWADEADPAAVMVTGNRLRKFRCSEGHSPRSTPWNFLHNGCPVCRGNTTREANTDALKVESDPDVFRLNREIASQWHPVKNGDRAVQSVSPGSRRTVWWRDPDCGHEWQATPAHREKGQRLRCLTCRTILDSLAYHYPEVAAEWSPSNPVTAWQVRPTGSTAFAPEWVCSSDPAHIWSASLASRAAGSACPYCRETGKSRVELEHFAAAVDVFGHAQSGQPVEHDAFVRRPRWLVDIVSSVGDGTPVAIEYDGAYWHAGKQEIDTAKSVDLLAAGYLVVRLRERPLPTLPITDACYLEVPVDSVVHEPARVIERVYTWACSTGSAAKSREHVVR